MGGGGGGGGWPKEVLLFSVFRFQTAPDSQRNQKRYSVDINNISC